MALAAMPEGPLVWVLRRFDELVNVLLADESFAHPLLDATFTISTIATNEYGGAAERAEYHPCVAWDWLADQVSFGRSTTKSTNHTSRAVNAPAATVGHPPHGTVHK
jgi:hypothetical protein